MGHHFIPQAYLRAFADPNDPAKIWLYDKRGDGPRLVPIKRTAQSKRYYDDDVEQQLAHAIERPANAVMRKLRAGELVSADERMQLAVYIGVMLKRVPYRREKSYALFPETWKELIADVRSEILRIAATTDIAPEIVERRLAEVDEVAQRHRIDPPNSVHDVLRQPWPTEAMVTALFHMTWRVLKSDGPSFFLTSDNPAYFHESDGLATAEAELAFPLSTTHVLHGCWNGPRAGLLIGAATQKIVREVNRRVASTTSRLAFYFQREELVLTLRRKTNPYLSRIRWH